MLGAIAGDIIGSVYEARPTKRKDFPLFQAGSRFTDDSVLTIAVAQAVMSGRSYVDAIRALGRKYPNAGYGGTFFRWLFSDTYKPYNSWGNGSAMRVSPIGFAFDDPDRVLSEAARSAMITHSHPEGIKGAQATALSVHVARTTRNKAHVKQEISTRFKYDLDRTVDQIRPDYCFDVSCQGSVPEAIIAFLDSSSYEDAVRNAVSLGGDSDTLACIAGGIAEAYYGHIPGTIVEEVKVRLDSELWDITERFCCEFVAECG
mgnify:FL=1